MIFTSAARGADFALVGPDGAISQKAKIDLGPGTYTNLIALGGDEVDLFWLVRSEQTGRLISARPTDDGTFSEAPALVADRVRFYSARRTATGTAALVADAQGVRLLTRQSNQSWSPAGQLWTPPAEVTALDLQVLKDGSVLGLVQTRHAEKEYRHYLVRGSVGLGITGGAEIDQFVVPTGEGLTIMKQASLGVDTTHAYVIYSIETENRQTHERSERHYVLASPLADTKTWSRTEHGRQPRPVADGVSATSLFTPTVASGQFETLQVAFQAETRSRFRQGLGLLVATFQNGKLSGFDLISHEQGGLRPSLARGESGSLVTWASYASGSAQQLYLASSFPSMMKQLDGTGAAEWLQATGETMLDLVQSFTLLMTGAIWALPAITFVLLLYLVALRWVEWHPKEVFWIGVVSALLLQVYAGMQTIRNPHFAAGMPPLLTLPFVPESIYLGISGGMLGSVLRDRPPSRERGGLAPLVWWLAGTLILQSLLFGPFARRG